VARRQRYRFVLDHNFPNSPLVSTPFPDIEFVALRVEQPDLVKDHDDWQVLQQLKARGGYQGFVTLDANMLSLSKEMVVLHQTRHSLVVVEGTGNDPLAAGGALVASAARIARLFDGRKPQLFRVRVPGMRSERAWDQITTIAQREQDLPARVVKREQLTQAELRRDCRSPTP
jgi:predicted glycosyltransferase